MGFLYGFLTAFFTSVHNRAIRQYREIDTFQLNAARFFLGSITLGLIVSFFIGWNVPLSRSFWVVVFVTVFFEVLVTFCYVRAFQCSEQSLVGPLFGLSPLFLVPLGMVFLNETPSLLGFAGVVLVFLGALSLSWGEERARSFRTFYMQVMREKGAAYMLAAVFFASIAVTLTKKGFTLVEPLVFGFLVVFLLFIVYAIVTLFRLGIRGLFFGRPALTIGVLHSMSQVFHLLGLSMLPAAYFISTKRTSIIFDVLIGHFSGREIRFTSRFIGALVIFAGILLFIFWG